VRKVIIGNFKPTAIQILDTALHLTIGSKAELVIGTKPEDSPTWSGRRKKDYEGALKYLQDIAARGALKPQVFLGGACAPTTWRQDTAIPILEEAGVAYYNPQVTDWDEKDAEYKKQGIPGGIIEVEAREKNTSQILLFVFDPQTRGLASMAEVVEYLRKGQHKVILVAGWLPATLEIGGQVVTQEEIVDINAARSALFHVAKTEGAVVFSDVASAVEHCIELLKQETDYWMKNA